MDACGTPADLQGPEAPPPQDPMPVRDLADQAPLDCTNAASHPWPLALLWSMCCAALEPKGTALGGAGCAAVAMGTEALRGRCAELIGRCAELRCRCDDGCCSAAAEITERLFTGSFQFVRAHLMSNFIKGVFLTLLTFFRTPEFVFIFQELGWLQLTTTCCF